METRNIKGDYYTRKSKLRLALRNTFDELKKQEKAIAKKILYRMAQDDYRVGKSVVNDFIEEYNDPFIISEEEE